MLCPLDYLYLSELWLDSSALLYSMAALGLPIYLALPADAMSAAEK